MPSSSFGGGSKHIINYCYSSSSSSSSTTSMMGLLMIIMLVLQIWICHDCQVGAIRILPTTESDHHDKMESSKSSIKSNQYYKQGDDLVHKYFGGRSVFHFNTTAAATTTTTSATHEKGGLADDKRRVPSCPDPLHN